LSYQWKKDGANVTGATAATYAITSASSTNAGNYTCLVTGGCGSVTSNAAALTVNTATTVSNPSNQTVAYGSQAVFNVTASGTGPFTYQWKHGTVSVGANSNTLTISSASGSDAGSYTCMVTGACGGAVASNAATLTVQCTVTFSSPGAFQAANPSTITVNTGASVGTLPTPPIKNNVDFSYWQTSSNTAFTATSPVNQNMTITAVWKTILDNDGNQYNTITIGNLTWLATNLKTTSLPNKILGQGYSGSTDPAYDWFYSDPANGSIYGALYNWAAATSPNIAPPGWHVATLADWNNLINSFPDTATAMNAIKESGTTHWQSPNPATNSTNFTALPGGFMVSGMSRDLQLDGNWWTTTPYDNGSNGYSIYIGNSMSVSSSSTTVMFLSIRCVRN
jgi:uncharacterized protein (TIGR02145 family)